MVVYIPKVNTKYYYISTDGVVRSRIWTGGKIDELVLLGIGNVYRDKDDATDARTRAYINGKRMAQQSTFDNVLK